MKRALLILLIAAIINVSLSQAHNELVPGLQMFPANVTCCPTLPLIGPAWMVDISSLTLNVNHQCSFVPTLSRPMVFVFQPNGVVNGFSDQNACHYFHGSYQISGGSSYDYDFRWSRWKSQPYSCMPVDCGDRDNDIDIFWARVSSSVTTLSITGYTNLELRDAIGQVVVRLEALPSSFNCEGSTIAAKKEACDPVLKIPKLDLLGGMTNNIMDYTPGDLATGGGGIHVVKLDPNTNADGTVTVDANGQIRGNGFGEAGSPSGTTATSSSSKNIHSWRKDMLLMAGVTMAALFFI